MALPAELYCAIGHSAAHMSTSRAVPATAVSRRATPVTSATPMPSRPSMNSQSAHAAPAISPEGRLERPGLDVPEKSVGRRAAMNPGFCAGGRITEAESLSRKGYKKMKPKAIRRTSTARCDRWRGGERVADRRFGNRCGLGERHEVSIESRLGIDMPADAGAVVFEDPRTDHR